LAPLSELTRHVLAGERLHGDDTTVPVLAKNKTATGRLWTPLSRGQALCAGRPAVRRP